MGIRNPKNMKSLNDLMAKQEIVPIQIDLIKPNPDNFYANADPELEQELVIQLADSMEEDGGQAEPGIVYEDVDEDGKPVYVLLSGERRYKAVKYNHEERGGTGNFNALVVPKPNSKLDEIKLIIRSNGIRKKDTATRLKEVEELSKLYDERKAAKVKGENLGRKREWIGGFCGLSPRQVQEYLNMLKAPKEVETSITSDGNETEDEDTVRTIEEKEALKQKLQDLSDAIAEVSGLKVSIKSNWVIQITPKTKDMDGVREVLDKLGIAVKEEEYEA